MKDNHEALNISGLQGNSVTKRVIMPKFDLETNLDAAVQEGSDDLTFRLQEKGSEMSFVDTGVVKKDQWGNTCEGGLACQVSGPLHWHRSFGLEADAPPDHGHGQDPRRPATSTVTKAKMLWTTLPTSGRSWSSGMKFTSSARKPPWSATRGTRKSFEDRGR